MPPALLHLTRALAASGAAGIAEELDATDEWHRWVGDCRLRGTDPLTDKTNTPASSPSTRSVQRRLGGTL
jgi:hypothetical protein